MCGYSDRRDDGNVLIFDYINVNILVMILYYSFARGYHWGKVSTWYVGFLGIISCNSWESPIISINVQLKKAFFTISILK